MSVTGIRQIISSMASCFFIAFVPFSGYLFSRTIMAGG
jgi:hypothetical protein